MLEWQHLGDFVLDRDWHQTNFISMYVMLKETFHDEFPYFHMNDATEHVLNVVFFPQS